MNILLLRGFNNYFNRIVKKYTAIADYKINSASFLDFSGINFNPNDGVATELIIGSSAQLENNAALSWDSLGTPDYLVCYTMEGETPAAVIKSRWFVLESERTRDGQYRIALKRDVLAEHYDDIKTSPCFIEKGYITDANNPLVVNSEGSQVNQIKQNEVLLKDDSRCAWLVGYMKKDLNQINASGTPSNIIDPSIIASGVDFGDCITYKAANGTTTQQATKKAVVLTGLPDVNAAIEYDHLSVSGHHGLYGMYTNLDASNFNWTRTSGVINGIEWCNVDYAVLENSYFWLTNDYYHEVCRNITNYTKNNGTAWSAFQAMVNDLRNNFLANVSYNNLPIFPTTNDLVSRFNGKYIYKDNVLYKLSVVLNNTADYIAKGASMTQCPSIRTYFSLVAGNLSDTSLLDNSTTQGHTQASYGQEMRAYSIIATESAVPGTLSVTIPNANTRNTVNDELYDMFAIPYNPDWEESEIVFGNTIIDSGNSLFIAQKIMTELQVQSAGAEGYDLQLLPYCPLDLAAGDPLTNFTEGKDYSWVKDTNDNKKTIVFYPTKANFTKNLTYTAQLHRYDRLDPATDFKPVPAAAAGQSRLKYLTWYVIPNLSATLDPSITGTIRVATTSYNNIILRKISKDYGNTIEELRVNSVEIDLDHNNELFFGEYVGGSYHVLRTVTKADYEAADYYYVFYLDSNSYGGRYINEGLCEFLKLIDLEISSLDKKISNETEFMRLTSPNFNSLFEFKLSKFEDGIHYINVDCTYKPFSPYIKLNPDFSWLYGVDFNDSTGLILSGDFSLSTMSDAWIQYELNNKNYQSIFNRQIQSLDVSQQIAREQLRFQNIAGMFGGTAGGAVTGALTGAKAGPYGAIAGAAVGLVGGAALSGLGAVYNQDWLQRQQAEAKSYAIDMYNYNLGTIQALPQSISKSNPLTFNNKVWPILEEFSCTEEEKELLKNKIQYNGMTIMAIGALDDYSHTDKFDKCFVKGQLIRVESVNDDFHIIDALYQEVNKGFYIPQ